MADRFPLRIWMRIYANGPKLSLTKKSGFVAYVAETHAVAMFVQEGLQGLARHRGFDRVMRFDEVEMVSPDTVRRRPKRGRRG